MLIETNTRTEVRISADDLYNFAVSQLEEEPEEADVSIFFSQRNSTGKIEEITVRWEQQCQEEN
jgi:hypothetical protein